MRDGQLHLEYRPSRLAVTGRQSTAEVCHDLRGNGKPQSHATTKQPGDGVGLGLAISSQIVTDLGGRLMARNGQTGGAVFEMQLPITQKDSHTQAAE